MSTMAGKVCSFTEVKTAWAGCGEPGGPRTVLANTASNNINLWVAKASANRYVRVVKTAAANTLTIQATILSSIWGNVNPWSFTMTGIGDVVEFISDGVSEWVTFNGTVIVR